MDDTTSGPVAAPARGSARHPRGRVSVVGVLGELLLTAGAVVLLFAAWQLWIGDMIYGSQNNAAGQALSQEWAAQSGDPTAPSEASATPSPTADSAAPVAHEPIVMSQPGSGEYFGVMHIPRFGSD